MGTKHNTSIESCKSYSDNPDFRYVVGKDAVMALESRRNMFVNPGLQKVAREIDSRQLRIEIYFSRR